MNACMTNRPAVESRPEPRARFQPNCDAFETADELTLRLDVPGARADAINITCEEDVLTVEAPAADRQPAGTRFLLREYAIGDYARQFRLGRAIDSTRITAEYRDGVLTVHLPKAEASKPRRIPLKAS